MICNNCGSKLAKGSAFCHKCATPVLGYTPTTAAYTPPKKNNPAIIISIFMIVASLAIAAFMIFTSDNTAVTTETESAAAITENTPNDEETTNAAQPSSNDKAVDAEQKEIEMAIGYVLAYIDKGDLDAYLKVVPTELATAIKGNKKAYNDFKKLGEEYTKNGIDVNSIAIKSIVDYEGEIKELENTYNSNVIQEMNKKYGLKVKNVKIEQVKMVEFDSSITGDENAVTDLIYFAKIDGKWCSLM